MHNPFRCFNSSPEEIRLTVMLYVRCPLSLRQIEDILYERGIDICHGAERGAADRSLAVEPLRLQVGRGDQTEKGGEFTGRPAVAPASGRGLP